ncbi:hypothetical protein LCGC14_2932780, partial [marine sediment metagenome]
FLAASGRIALADVTIDCRNEFAAVMVISLDGLALADSRSVLIQAMTQERPYGFRAAGGRIADLGEAPFGVRKIAATVTLKLTGTTPAKVTALDENGYARKDPVPATAGASGLTIHLLPDALYHVVKR